MFKKLTVLGLAVAISASYTPLSAKTTLAAAAASQIQFTDISGHWAESTIKWAIANDIAHGYEDNTFRPNAQVTKAEFLTLLLNSYHPAGLDPTKIKIGSYKSRNVEQVIEDWQAPYILYARKMNYLTETYFDKISPQDVGKEGVYLDTKIKYNDPLRNSPDLPINRKSVAVLVTSTLGLNFTNSQTINDSYRYLMVNGLAVGKNEVGSVDDKYAPSDNLTRAEAVQFIKNIKDKLGNIAIKPRPNEDAPIHDLYKNETWTKGEVVTLGTALFPLIRDNGDSYTFTIPKLPNVVDLGKYSKELRAGIIDYTQMPQGRWTMLISENKETPDHTNNVAFEMGESGIVKIGDDVQLLVTLSDNHIPVEDYTIDFKTGLVKVMKMVNNEQIHETVTLETMLQIFGTGEAK
jgi:hypothetical protein